MHVHASCAARGGAGVLLMGPPGTGKSDLILRLLDHGFALVGDDQIEVSDGVVRPVATLAGLLEVRGLGIVRMPYVASARLALAVRLGEVATARLPEPARQPLADAWFGVPVIPLDPSLASAASRVALALDCVTGRRVQLAGAFSA